MTTLLNERIYARGGIVGDVVLPVTQDAALPEQLRAREIVTFRFAASDWKYVRAWQSGVIEDRLDRHPEDFYVWSIQYDQPGLLIFKIRIKDDPSKLWTEVLIARLISDANPRGVKLAFIQSYREFREGIMEPVVEVGANLALLALLGFLLWTLSSVDSRTAVPQG